MLYPPIGPLPATPSRNSPSEFSPRMDALLAALPVLRSEINALAAYLDKLALATGPGLFLNGSAAVPALSFASSPDTGLFRVGANILGFATGGVERMRLTSNGLLTGSVVTQSETDTTSRRLLKVGDFGNGQAVLLTSEDNLNDLVASGSYFNSAAANTIGNNYPNMSAGALDLIYRGVNNAVQKYTTYAGNDRITGIRDFVRSRGPGGYVAWSERFHQGSILGPVSQSEGVPTGAVLQHVTSANGRSERNAAGGQRCTRSNLSAVSATAAAGARFASANITWTFPAAFLAGTVPAVSLAALDPDCDIRIVSLTNTAVVFKILSDVSKSSPITVTGSADGVWSTMT